MLINPRFNSQAPMKLEKVNINSQEVQVDEVNKVTEELSSVQEENVEANSQDIMTTYNKASLNTNVKINFIARSDKSEDVNIVDKKEDEAEIDDKSDINETDIEDENDNRSLTLFDKGNNGKTTEKKGGTTEKKGGTTEKKGGTTYGDVIISGILLVKGLFTGTFLLDAVSHLITLAEYYDEHPEEYKKLLEEAKNSNTD